MSGTLYGGRMIKPAATQGETINALPVGAVTAWMGSEIPKDFLPFEGQLISLMDYPELCEAVWCGATHNETADFFYRTADAKGAVRMATGGYLKMPDGAKYFMRGRDDAEEVHPYRYQDWAIENIVGISDPHFAPPAIAALDLSQTPFTVTPGRSSIAVAGGEKANQYVLGFDAGKVVKAADETRPMNFPVKWIIRAANSTLRADGVDVVALKAKVDGMEALIEGVASGTGVPVGSIIEWGGRADSIPPGYINITTDTIQAVLVNTYPAFTNAVWCGEAHNADADFFYRCENADGTGRSHTGQYIVLPMASKYFMRGRDAGDVVNPYQYQDWAIENITGEFAPQNIQDLGPASIGIYRTAPSNSTALATGAFKKGRDLNGPNTYGQTGQVGVPAATLAFDASGSVKTDIETRPMNFPVLYLIKLYEAVYNPAMLDISQLIEQAVNNAVPLGMVAGFQTKEAPPGWVALNAASELFLPVETVPQFAACYWCGAEYNDTADFAYRCDNPDGTERNIDGAYIALMAAGKRFMRGRDVTGAVHPYRYQEDAIRNITGAVGLSYVTGTPTFGFGTQSSGVFGNSISLGKEERSGMGYVQSSSMSGYGYPVPYLDASLQVPTADENRPANFPVLWCIKVASATVNQGLIDVTRLLNQYAALSLRMSQLEERKADRQEVFGIGQSWEEVLGQRSAGTNYTNTTGKPVQLYVCAVSTSATGHILLNVSIDDGNGAKNIYSQKTPYSSIGYQMTELSPIIPPGATYRVTVNNGNLCEWYELR